MSYLTITGVVIFCVFILMYVGSTKDELNPFNQILNALPPDNVRFMTAMADGELVLSNETVRKFADVIKARDEQIMADYTARDLHDSNEAVARMVAKDNAVISAYKAADMAYYKSNQTDAQSRANTAKTAAISAANSNTANYYVRRGANYALKMGPGNHAGGNRYLYGSQYDWKVLYNKGDAGAKWQLV